jgi:hypothetical protein
MATELVAQRVQQADPVFDGDGVPVQDEVDGRRRGRARTSRVLWGAAGAAQGAECPRLS